MHETGLREKTLAVYFISLATLMYYLLTQIINIPYTIPVRQIVVVMLLFSEFVCFVIRPNIARCYVSIKGALVLAAPLLVMVTVSLPIWFAQRVEWTEIYRSSWNYFLYVNQLLAALVAAMFLYLFGEKGIWYNLCSLLIANFMMIVTIMLENGVAVYLNELFRLIVTFAGETGEVIGKAEIHELAFCLGAYLVYMLLFFKKKSRFLILFGAALFCFLSAFKRIAMVAILISVLLGKMMRFLHAKGRDKTAKSIMTVILLGAVAALVLYIAFVRSGGFHFLEEIGVDTMSRADMYDQVKDEYTFSPAYAGQGMGHLSYHLTREEELWENAIHNDFLQFYIDLGFWGYIVWLLSLTVFRFWYFGGAGKMESGILTFSMTCYILILSSTDNTLNYQLVYTATGILMLGHDFDQRVRETDERLFGFVEKQNREESAADAEGKQRKRKKRGAK